MIASPLVKTVRAVHRRTWLEQNLRLAASSLRLTAAAAWLLVAFDLLFMHVSILVVAALAGFALAISQLWGVFHRPPDPVVAALRLDRWLDTNELITTAWYLHGRPNPSVNAAQIMEAAENVCVARDAEVRRRSSVRVRGYIPLGLILMAGLPLTQAGHVPLFSDLSGPHQVRAGAARTSLLPPASGRGEQPLRAGTVSATGEPYTNQPGPATPPNRDNPTATANRQAETGTPGPGSMGSRLPARPGARAADVEPQTLPAVKRIPLALRSTQIAATYDGHDGTELLPATVVPGQRTAGQIVPAALPPERLQGARESFPIGAYIRRYSTRRSDDSH